MSLENIITAIYMKTKDIHQVVSILKNGGLALFPTDTVWGLGCSIQRLDAITRFYELKRREKNKPTAVLTSSLQQAQLYGRFTKESLSLARLYWPGDVTLIVQTKKNVPQKIIGENKTIGLRVPNFPIVQNICKHLQAGVVAGSANFAGDPPPKHQSQIDQRLKELVDVMYDGECGGRSPSTVVDTTIEPFKILRQGSVLVKV